ncbi:MAG: YceI family protein [Chloroflexota bacterium]
MMKKTLIVGTAVAALAMAVIAYALFKPPEEASGPLEAIPVRVETQQPAAATSTPANVSTGSTPTALPPQEATATLPAVEPGKAAGETPVAEATPTETQKPDAAPAFTIFEIVQAESEARFKIDEVLQGAPKTVIGITDQIAGEIAIHTGDPPLAQIGTILVNARTLTTDNEFRNRAIKNRILQTDTYEFVTFAPTEILGLPASVSVGESLAFQIVGHLTVRDVSRQVVFEATVTPVSETRLEGSARTTILYADFDLSIPDSPSVDTVEDEVTLELDFVAVAR